MVVEGLGCSYCYLKRCHATFAFVVQGHTVCTSYHLPQDLACLLGIRQIPQDALTANDEPRSGRRGHYVLEFVNRIQFGIDNICLRFLSPSIRPGVVVEEGCIKR